jgi:4-hydroxy-tetrahydrodipicolinate reductase
MKQTAAYRVVFYGLGEIGKRALRMALESTGISVVGAIDTDRKLVGKDLAEIAGLSQETGVAVSDNALDVLASSKPDVAIHTTSSLIEEVKPQISTIISEGVSCVSSTEEMFHPRPDTHSHFMELHEEALEKKVSILGTGVNPGYVMDSLPLFLAKSCECIHSVMVERIVDASTRRLPLQRKVGMGLHPDDFTDLVNRKKMGHRGLTESLYALAHGFGWKLDRVDEEVEPVIAQNRIETDFFTVEPGMTMGMKHSGYGYKQGKRVIFLDLQMYVNPRRVYDRVVIEGVPSIETTLKGGIPGDSATASILIHSVPSVVELGPGFINLGRMPFVHSMFFLTPDMPDS